MGRTGRRSPPRWAAPPRAAASNWSEPSSGRRGSSASTSRMTRMSDAAPTPGDTITPHPATQFSALWRGGEPPDLAEFLGRLGPLPEADLVAVLLVDQRRRWEAGHRTACEEY